MTSQKKVIGGFKWPGLILFLVFAFGKSAGFISLPWWPGLLLLLFLIPYYKTIDIEKE